MNWKIPFSIALFNMSLVACEDQKTSAKPEIVKLADPEQQLRETVEAVMTFLKSANFDLTIDKSEESISKNRIHIDKTKYKNFRYSYEDKLLTFELLGSTYINDTLKSYNFESAFLTEYKIDLRSAGPLVNVKDHTDPNGKVLPAKEVGIRAKYAERWIQADASSLTAEDEEKIKNQPFKEFRERNIDFIVSPEIAPRLKNALEDLLKAHGVVVSKY